MTPYSSGKESQVSRSCLGFKSLICMCGPPHGTQTPVAGVNNSIWGQADNFIWVTDAFNHAVVFYWPMGLFRPFTWWFKLITTYITCRKSQQSEALVGSRYTEQLVSTRSYLQWLLKVADNVTNTCRGCKFVWKVTWSGSCHLVVADNKIFLTFPGFQQGKKLLYTQLPIIIKDLWGNKGVGSRARICWSQSN